MARGEGVDYRSPRTKHLAGRKQTLPRSRILHSQNHFLEIGIAHLQNTLRRQQKLSARRLRPPSPLELWIPRRLSRGYLSLSPLTTMLIDTTRLLDCIHTDPIPPTSSMRQLHPPVSTMSPEEVFYSGYHYIS
ncbi:hypothetical protein DL93DRAFT_1177214 [Clavulina sp. PMI_390]|nr:hypothetical protein DL93DRAFT_1177214 [Clavulina sp. PMI_390]